MKRWQLPSLTSPLISSLCIMKHVQMLGKHFWGSIKIKACKACNSVVDANAATSKAGKKTDTLLANVLQP